MFPSTVSGRSSGGPSGTVSASLPGTFPSVASGTSSGIVSAALSGAPLLGTASNIPPIEVSNTSARTTSCGASVKSFHTVSCGVSGTLSGLIVQGISSAACSVAWLAALCASCSARFSSGVILFQHRNLPISSRDSCMVIVFGSLEGRNSGSSPWGSIR